MVISSINVDLTRLTPAPIAYAKQGDANTRYIAVSLYDDGEPYTIPSGMIAAFRLAKPDGTFCFYDNENGEAAVTTSGNVATILLAEQALTAAGKGYAEVNLYDANGKLTSFTFILEIQASVLPDDAISTNYVSFLTEIAQQILKAGIGIRPLGFYDTLSDLEAAVTDPAPGDVYAVGNGAPYYYYAWDITSETWVNMGEVRSKGLVILGNYATLAALEAAVTDPERGDAYGVGSTKPYTLYIWNGSAWVNWGELSGISVTDAQINNTGELVFSFSDGTSDNVGRVVGDPGVYYGSEQPDGEEYDIWVNPDGNGGTPFITVNVTLSAAAWSGNIQDVSVPGKPANADGDVDLADAITAEEYEAAVNAGLRKTSEALASMTITAFNEVPTIDIPLKVKWWSGVVE